MDCDYLLQDFIISSYYVTGEKYIAVVNSFDCAISVADNVVSWRVFAEIIEFYFIRFT